MGGRDHGPVSGWLWPTPNLTGTPGRPGRLDDLRPLQRLPSRRAQGPRSGPRRRRVQEPCTTSAAGPGAADRVAAAPGRGTRAARRAQVGRRPLARPVAAGPAASRGWSPPLRPPTHRHPRAAVQTYPAGPPDALDCRRRTPQAPPGAVQPLRSIHPDHPPAHPVASRGSRAAPWVVPHGRFVAHLGGRGQGAGGRAQRAARRAVPRGQPVAHLAGGQGRELAPWAVRLGQWARREGGGRGRGRGPVGCAVGTPGGGRRRWAGPWGRGADLEGRSPSGEARRHDPRGHPPVQRRTSRQVARVVDDLVPGPGRRKVRAGRPREGGRPAAPAPPRVPVPQQPAEPAVMPAPPCAPPAPSQVLGPPHPEQDHRASPDPRPRSPPAAGRLRPPDPGRPSGLGPDPPSTLDPAGLCPPDPDRRLWAPAPATALTSGPGPPSGPVPSGPGSPLGSGSGRCSGSGPVGRPGVRTGSPAGARPGPGPSAGPRGRAGAEGGGGTPGPANGSAGAGASPGAGGWRPVAGAGGGSEASASASNDAGATPVPAEPAASEGGGADTGGPSPAALRAAVGLAVVVGGR